MDWTAVFLVVCVMTNALVDTVLDSANWSRPANWSRVQRIIESNWWLYVSAMFMESSTRTPRSLAGRLVLAVWWLTVVVLMNAFTGHMKATMMLVPEPERIDSVRDVSCHPDLRPFVWKGGAYEDLLKNAYGVEVYRIVWAMTVARDGLRDMNRLYEEENLRQVLEGTAVIMSDHTSQQYHMSRTCRRRLAAGSYYFGEESSYPTKLAMAMRKGVDLGLLRLIDKRVSWLGESGIIQAWIEAELGDWQSCLSGSHEDTYNALSLFEVQSVFLLFFTTAALSLLVFCAEMAIAATSANIQRKHRLRRIKIFVFGTEAEDRDKQGQAVLPLSTVLQLLGLNDTGAAPNPGSGWVPDRNSH
uniref:Ionotropic glutamate receptor C-terminal domain-containing protein n=1 Tax=Amblyomma maculatum TaxID=34609 RepID=G3MT09_AMBMU